MVWVDTHIHLDATEYAQQHDLLVTQARQVGVQHWLIPSVYPDNFVRVKALAHSIPGAAYALGIHPMYVDHCQDDALDVLAQTLADNKDDPLLVAVGEIGLDHFVPNQDLVKQTHFFRQQLKLARQYNLPVLLHIRRAQDTIAKLLRQYPVSGGIAHAFNGSFVQAQVFIQQGLCLGFGGAATYTRARNIRELLKTVPEQAIVLETDGPDLAPEWLHHQVNPPQALANIGECLAQIRGMSSLQFQSVCLANSQRQFPKWQALHDNQELPI